MDAKAAQEDTQKAGGHLGFLLALGDRASKCDAALDADRSGGIGRGAAVRTVVDSATHGHAALYTYGCVGVQGIGAVSTEHNLSLLHTYHIFLHGS